jgi:hypothetical protein
MPEFWQASGYDLLDRRADGTLAVSDSFLAAYLARPEMAPVRESCAAERALHRALLDEPRRTVTAVHLVAIRDRDARENYEVFLRYRDWLLRHETLEAAYLALYRDGAPPFPSLFVNHLVAAILRGILSECADAFQLRAAELLYRVQKISIEHGAILAADAELVEMHAAGGGAGSIGHLIVAAGGRPRAVELDVLTPDNAPTYWTRSDRFDFVLDLTFARPGLDGLCRVLEAWVRHLRGVEVAIQPVQAIRDERWAWHVGLDAEASGILNDMYNGVEVDQERLYRVLSLFRLDFRDTAAVLPRVAGKPVYLAMAMDAGNTLPLKPQNLLVNLPLPKPL